MMVWMLSEARWGFKVPLMRRLISYMTRVHAVWTERMSCGVCFRFHDKTCVIKWDILGICRHISLTLHQNGSDVTETTCAHIDAVEISNHLLKSYQKPNAVINPNILWERHILQLCAHTWPVCTSLLVVHALLHAHVSVWLSFFSYLQYFLFYSHKTCSGMM